MPVFRSGHGLAPAWCTLEFFEIIDLEPGQAHAFDRVGDKEKIIVLEGECEIGTPGQDHSAEQAGEAVQWSVVGTKRSLSTEDAAFSITRVLERTRALRICGRWGDGCETFGIFTPAGRVRPRDKGDAFDYPKTNGMDRHYHDCDEYWIICEGRGRAVSEGRFYDVGPGDCVATGMGHHHDFPEDFEPVKAVFMETDLEGQKRHGHLWEYRHGTAEPRPERV